ncbi:hypothetical protein CRYUN_Cryun07bG0011800 [Craigia yunnanensis]
MSFVVLNDQIISLSAFANKLSNIQKQVEEYAALIMEELDPDHLGYIMTWMYLAVPDILYLYERLTRVFRSSINAVTILKAVVYLGNVLALHMSRPHGFRYKSGQYMFVNCVTVSLFEW